MEVCIHRGQAPQMAAHDQRMITRHQLRMRVEPLSLRTEVP